MISLNLNFGILFLEIVVLSAGLLLFLMDRFVSRKGYAFWISIILSLFLVFIILFLPFGEFTRAFRSDFYSATVKFLLTIGFFFMLTLSKEFLDNFSALKFGEFYGLLLFSLLGAYVMLSSQDLLTLFLGLELLSIPLYFLIATNTLYQRRSVEGAIKYFIAGGISSLFFILSTGIFYYLTGSLYFNEILAKLALGDFRSEVMAGLVFLVIAFSIKLSLVPFHMWAPDAYEASPVPVTAFLAGFVKFAVLSALVKVLILAFSPIRSEAGQIILWVALLSVLVGSLLAVIQDNLIRLLAYSSIAHIGYAMLGLISGEYVGYGFSIFYALVYLFMTLGIFSVIIHLYSSNREILQITGLSGLSKEMPFLAFLALLFLFSLAGIPPTAGFMAKFYIFVVLIKGNFLLSALLALLFSVIGAYPYLKIVKIIYMDKPVKPFRRVSFSFFTYLTLIISSVLIIILGVYPQPFIEFIHRTLYLYLTFQLMFF